MKIVDGGYLTWVFGMGKGGGWGGWATARMEYIGQIITMDGTPLARQKIFPDYKISREIKKQKDPLYAAKREKVRAFRQIIDSDPLLVKARWPGLEADDLLVLFHMLSPQHSVVSVDKDLFQVPGMMGCMHTTKGESIAKRTMLHPRFPKYSGNPKCGEQFVLTQCLLGDKSDSVPRLLPSHPGIAKEIFHGLSCSSRPLEAAYKLYKQAFLLNLLVLLVPSPTLLYPLRELQKHPSYVMEQIHEGTYWNKENISSEVKEWMNKKMSEARSLSRKHSRLRKHSV